MNAAEIAAVVAKAIEAKVPGVPVYVHEPGALRVELLDNPNDRTNYEVVVEALMAGGCETKARRDDAMECTVLFDENDDGDGRWRHCLCAEEARKAIAALEAAGRLVMPGQQKDAANAVARLVGGSA